MYRLDAELFEEWTDLVFNSKEALVTWLYENDYIHKVHLVKTGREAL